MSAYGVSFTGPNSRSTAVFQLYLQVVPKCTQLYYSCRVLATHHMNFGTWGQNQNIESSNTSTKAISAKPLSCLLLTIGYRLQS